MTGISIRAERDGDRTAIQDINRLAFAGEEEGRLIDRLWAEGLVVASLVAVSQDAVSLQAGQEVPPVAPAEGAPGLVGHILFSRLDFRAEAGAEAGAYAAAALAPMCVHPQWQGRGIGGMLVRAGLQACGTRGVQIVLVLGHPEYYPRFGFSAALAAGIKAPFAGEAFMALALSPGVAEPLLGAVTYPEAFFTSA